MRCERGAWVSRQPTTKPGERLPRELRPWVGEGESLRLRLWPSGWAVVLESIRSIVGLVLVAGLVWVTLAAWGRLGAYGGKVGLYLAAAVGGRLLWQGVVVACRRYVITDRFVLRVAGVFARGAASLPVERVQHVVWHRTLLERLTGTGTIGFATAGTGGVEVAWVTVARPIERVEEVRRVIEQGKAGGDRAGEMPTPLGQGGGETNRTGPIGTGSRGAVEPVVIGLAGGIGAGKSEVARAFAELGCVVADSDKAAREALDREEVREQLVAWWGEEILGNEGRVDRKKVAKIVFADPAERERLEGLVHPIIRQGRQALIAEARAAGAPAVVLDAPLVFEARLDAECDAVVFVEASREIRLARVRETRGWDEAELARREKVQLPLDEKADRSDYCIVNDADASHLRVEVRRILDQILTHCSGTGTGSPRPDAG